MIPGLDYTGLPERFQGGLQHWVEGGQVPGGFLTAVLRNDLSDAVMRADSESLLLIRHVVQWLTAHAPGPSWGSVGAVRDWPKQAARNQKRAADAMRRAVRGGR